MHTAKENLLIALRKFTPCPARKNGRRKEGKKGRKARSGKG